MEYVILYKMIKYVLSRQYHIHVVDTELLAQIRQQNPRVIQLTLLRSVMTFINESYNFRIKTDF